MGPGKDVGYFEEFYRERIISTILMSLGEGALPVAASAFSAAC